MGRGTIVGGGSEGRFTVSLDYGSDIVAQRVSFLEGRISETEAKITTEEAALASLRLDASSLEDTLDLAINAYAATGGGEEGEEEREAVDKATLALLEKLKGIRLQEVKIEILQLELANLQGDLSYVQSLNVTETRSMWCADYTTDASGDSATIEVNGEQPKLLLAPGCPAPASSDGQFRERGTMSAEQVFLNAALLPGWQKWLPTYRTGHITAIDRGEDTADVTLDSAASSAQGLNINQSSSLRNVPIEYMNCNSGAFLVGDDVVVKFEGQDWSQPKIIGFADGPRPCAPKEIAFAIETAPGSTVTVNPGITYSAMYIGIAGEQTLITGLNRSATTPHNLPSPGWAEYQPREDTVFGGSYDKNDAVIRFDLALQRVEGADYFNTGSYGGNIIKVLEVEEHGASLVLTGEGQGQIESPSVSPGISYSIDNKTTTTVQNGEGEDITFAIGTFVAGFYSAYVSQDNVELFQDAEVYDAIFSNYYTAPASIVLVFNEKRFRYNLRYAGPIPETADPDTTFGYIPTGDTESVSQSYKRWLWATYIFDGVLPDSP